MFPSRQVTSRTFFLSLALAVTVAVLSCVVGWYRARNPVNYLGLYYGDNKYTMDRIDSAIENWRKTHVGLPESLELLRNNDEFYVELDQEGQVRDGWNNPIIYKIEGDDYELISYGEDGKPGGVWLDSDISNRKPFPPESFPPSFGLFHSNEIAGGLIATSIFAGFFSFLCGMAILREEVPRSDLTEKQQQKIAKRQKSAIIAQVVSFVFIALFAIGAAFVLGSVHLTYGEYH